MTPSNCAVLFIGRRSGAVPTDKSAPLHHGEQSPRRASAEVNPYFDSTFAIGFLPLSREVTALAQLSSPG
jgi:hypothetical protein